MSRSRDNIPGVALDRPWKYLLVPGVVIQWFIYMNPRRGFRESLEAQGELAARS